MSLSNRGTCHTVAAVMPEHASCNSGTTNDLLPKPSPYPPQWCGMSHAAESADGICPFYCGHHTSTCLVNQAPHGFLFTCASKAVGRQASEQPACDAFHHRHPILFYHRPRDPHPVSHASVACHWRVCVPCAPVKVMHLSPGAHDRACPNTTMTTTSKPASTPPPAARAQRSAHRVHRVERFHAQSMIGPHTCVPLPSSAPLTLPLVPPPPPQCGPVTHLSLSLPCCMQI